MATTRKTQQMTGLALFTAIVVVLQVIATFIHFGPFSITLALTPILVGAALYGTKASAYLGGVFGAVVLIACILGWDPGGAILWAAQPLLTAVICLGKGILAGLAAGLVYKLLARKNMLLGSVVAGIISPIVNTGLFLLALWFLFPDILAAWATGFGADVVTYVLTGLVGVNFILELCVNLILSSVAVRIIKARLGGSTTRF